MKKSFLTSSAFALLASTVPALAETTAKDPVTEVIVRGASSNLAAGAPAPDQKVPFSTSSVDIDTVDIQGGLTLNDALRNVPGAQPDFSFTGVHSPVFTLRGAIADSGTGNSRVMRDGVRLSNYGYASAFVERLDVVRGAGALTAVRTEPGGSVNVVTKTPQPRTFASAYAQVGAHNQGEAYLDGNLVLSAQNELATRLILTRSTSSEWRDAKDELSGLKWSISKSHADLYRVLFDFEATDQTYEPDFGVPGINGRPAKVPLTLQLGEPFAPSTLNNRIYTLQGDLRLSKNWQVSTRLLHADGHQTSVRNSVFSAVAGQPGVYTRATAYEPYGKRDTDSAQLSLTGTETIGGVAHNLFFGLDYQTEELDLLSLRVPAANSPNINIFAPVFGLVTAPSGTLTATSTRMDVTTKSLTLQDRIDLGRLGLVLGVQYVDQDFLYGTTGVLPVQEDRVNPKLGVTYEISANHSVFGSYSEGMAPNQATSKLNQSLPSRISKQWEAGWKGRFLDGRFTGSVAVYQLDQSNLLADDPSTAYAFDKTLAGEGRSRGLELAANGDISDSLRLDLAYGLTEAKYTRNSELAGKSVANTARHTLSVFVTHDWNAFAYTGLGLYGQSKRFADSQNTIELPAYARVDLTQGFRMEMAGNPVRLQVNIRNLLDKDYYVASHLHVSRYILPAEGRSVSLSLKLDF